MPFVPVTMTGLMTLKGASTGLLGTQFMPLVNATSTAVCTYLSTVPVVLTTNAVVGPGAGTYTGKVVGCLPDAMTSLMMIKAASSGLTGKDMFKLFSAVSFGVCTTLLTTALVQGAVIGGGPGVGQGKIIGLVPTALTGLIMLNMAGKLIAGTQTLQLADAISFGVCTHIMTVGTVMTVCIGAFTPPPIGPIPIPAAPGPGRLI